VPTRPRLRAATPGSSRVPVDRSSTALKAGEAAVIAALERLDPEYLLYVPCSSAARVLQHFAHREGTTTFAVAREEEGVGIACGFLLANRRVVLLMQDTGFGNSLTALTTFAIAYHLPLFIVATRTGGAAEINSAVPPYSDRLPQVLAAADIYTVMFDSRLPASAWESTLVGLYSYARTAHHPAVALVDLR